MFKKFVALVAFFPIFTLVSFSQSAPLKQWTKAIPISTGGEGWESSVAIDDAGTTVTLWDERTTKGFVTDRVWSRARPANGTWGSTTVVSRMNPSLQTTYVFPALRMSAAGDATAIWSDYDGVWTADRSLTGVWGTSQLLLSGVSSATFVMNSRGDAALMWGTGTVRGASTSIIVMRRPAGGIWGPQETVASGSYVGSNSIAISDNGDVMVAWETFSATCSIEICNLYDFVLHASRETASGFTWQDSGPLTAADATTHNAHPSIDPSGRAVVVYSVPGLLNSITQQAAGRTWSAPATVYTASIFMPVGLSCDSAGHATFTLLDLQAAAGKVVSINGSILNNSWRPAITVSGTDPSPNQVIYAANANGAAVLAWAAGDPNYTNLKIRVSARPSFSGRWTVPVSVSPAGAQLAAPESITMNSQGNAALIFSAFNGVFSNHTEFAVNLE